jgi:hypothetical protein
MRTLVAVLSMTLLAALSASAWMWRELRAERARNEELVAQLELPKAAASSGASLSSPPPTEPQPAPATASATVTAQAATSERPVVHGTAEESENYQRRLLGDPRYRAAWSEQQRLNYSLRRENLIRLLGFTTEQADAVIGVMIERQIAWMQKTPNTSEEVAADETAYQDALRELIGEDQRQRLEHYMESRASRMQVDRLRTHLTGDDALREAQIEPLIAALHVERAQLTQELEQYKTTLRAKNTDDIWPVFSERQTELTRAMHQRMQAAAGGILSPAQLDTFVQMLNRELEQHEAQQRMQRLQSKLSTTLATPAE